jgi:hypothetical protein
MVFRVRFWRWSLTAVTAVMMSACAPKPAPPIETALTTTSASADSLALASHYQQLQNRLLSQGLLRTDGGAGMPLTAAMLATNFTRIALYEEYSAGGSIAQAAPITLTRWQDPVRVSLTFGASVPLDRQAEDRGRVAAYLARLSRITGHPIGLSNTQPNFFITIANMDERRRLGPTIKAALPQLTSAQVAGVTNLDRSVYCLVWTQSNVQTGQYERAYVFIPVEQPDLMRQSCIHEELAQGLGLPNDSGLARPSIFNDDEEFALLTRQDELMLKMLYDPALRSGMTEAEARPIITSLAIRLLGGNT